MSLPFIGFALIKLEKAIGPENPEYHKSYSYLVTINEKVGRYSTGLITMAKLNENWDGNNLRLRMNENRFAMLDSTCIPVVLTEEEYLKKLDEWETKFLKEIEKIEKENE